MAYDERLAARVREMLTDNSDVREQPMFGGLAFLIAGRMAVAASGQGGLLVRVDAACAEQLLKTTAAAPMEMKGRTVRGWLRIDGEHLHSQRELAEWITIGTTAATSTPGSSAATN